MLGGKPMFPGSSTSNQLQKILEVTGYPSPEDIDSLQSAYAKNMLESVQSTVSAQPKKLSDLYPTGTHDAIDLLSKLLSFNPTKRPTAEQALEHPYLAQFHNVDEEPICEKKIIIGLDDNVKLSINTYRDTLYKFIRQQRDKSRHRHGSGSQISPSTSQTMTGSQSNLRASSSSGVRDGLSTGDKEKDKHRDSQSKLDTLQQSHSRASSASGSHHQQKSNITSSNITVTGSNKTSSTQSAPSPVPNQS
ncbi:MAG: putative Kinase, CMGC MAPK, partial [Streblomastix strix]